MWFVWIIFEASQRLGTCRPERRPPSRVVGGRVQALSSLAPFSEELGSLPFIAEDLGQITPDVYALRDQFQLPGMRVLQFAFDGHADNPHLPENYVTNTVVYTGTHDNPTTRGWYRRFAGRPAAESVERAEAA